MSLSRIARRVALVGLSLFALSTQSSCTTLHRQRAMEIALFPINVAPDVISNTLGMLALPAYYPVVYPDSNTWGLVFIFAPVFGPLAGIKDAWYGYPFWDPAILDPGRSYDALDETGSSGSSR